MPARGRATSTFVAERFGDLAAGWQLLYEPNCYCHLAYGATGWPPGFDVRFGLIDRDRNVKPSARVLCRAAVV